MKETNILTYFVICARHILGHRKLFVGLQHLFDSLVCIQNQERGRQVALRRMGQGKIRNLKTCCPTQWIQQETQMLHVFCRSKDLRLVNKPVLV